MFENISNLGGLIAIIVGFGFIIFVHELGHFLAAKAVGIKATQFAIGFGQSMLTWRKGLGFRVGGTEEETEKLVRAHLARDLPDGENDLPKTLSPKQMDQAMAELKLGETEYRLNWMPLGGYVKMLGQEDLDPTAASDDERSFNNKPIWARSIVVCAGVVMNLIFGLLFLTLAIMWGLPLPPAIVGGVVPGSPAATTYADGHKNDPNYLGLQPGDQITHNGDEKLADFLDLKVNVALASPGERLALRVKRDGEDQPLVFRPLPQAQENGSAEERLLSIGVAPAISVELGKSAGTVKPLGYTATQRGLTPGMKITMVNGEKVTRFDQVEKRIADAAGKPVPVTFTSPDGKSDVTFDWAASPVIGEDGLLGLQPVTRVSNVVKDSPAAKAGIQPGDLLVMVGNTPWPNVLEVIKIVQQAKRDPIPMQVLRKGERITLEPVVAQHTGGRYLIGLNQTQAIDLPLVSDTLADSPMAGLHLTPGSQITAINDQPTPDFTTMQQVIGQAARSHVGDQPLSLKITYQLNAANASRETQTVAIDDPKMIESLRSPQWVLRSPSALDFLPLTERAAVDSWGQATMLGLHKTKQFMLQTYITIARLFQRSVPVDALRGPLGIAEAGTTMAKQGLPYLLFFLGLISVNLVVINFLPIPITDGGLMLFLIIEKLKGSPVNARIQTAATVVGLVLIGSIFLVTLYFDAGRIIFGQ